MNDGESGEKRLHEQRETCHRGLSVLFGWEPFVGPYYGGVWRSTVELAAALDRAGVRSEISAGLYYGHHPRDGDRLAPRLRGIALPARSRILGTRRIVERLNAYGERWLAERGSSVPVVQHRTWYSSAFRTRRRPLVVTVHDMIPEVLSLPLKGPPTKRRYCSQADAIMVPSMRTKSDLVEHFGIAESRVFVVALGCTVLPLPADPQLPVTPPFVLYVGNRDARYKRFSDVLDAVARRRAGGETLELVAASRGPVSSRDRGLVAARGLRGRVHFLSASDAELSWCYRHALALIYPSSYEGFGLPLLEAMQSGCPVICSDGGSIPEVVGDAAIRVPVGAIDQFAEAMQALLNDERLRDDVIGQGLERSSAFSWDRAAREALRVYQAVL